MATQLATTMDLPTQALLATFVWTVFHVMLCHATGLGALGIVLLLELGLLQLAERVLGEATFRAFGMYLERGVRRAVARARDYVETTMGLGGPTPVEAPRAALPPRRARDS